MSHDTSYDFALQVAQQAIAHLLKWVNADLPQQCPEPGKNPTVDKAKELLSWTDHAEIGALQLLFDRVCLADNLCHIPIHHMPMMAIANADPLIPYPLKHEPPSDAEQDAFRQTVKNEVLKVLQVSENWQNLSLLMLILEKYGSCLSFGESDVALVDRVKMTAAIAAALATDPEAQHLSLIAGDLSGIQRFIYTISSDGALKSLRARSFYLELLTEEIVQQLLEQLKLPRTNIIYAGGGNLYLLAPATDKTKAVVQSIRQQFNQWLLQEFQGKIFLALDQREFPTQDVATSEFANHWEAVIKQLAVQKNQKFHDQINQAIKTRISYDACRVCHRDDVRKLSLLSQDSIVEACSTCGRMFRLGGQLLRTEAIVRSHHVNQSDTRIRFKLPSKTVYYRLFDTIDAAFRVVDPDKDTILLINNWKLKHYQTKNTVPLLLGNYGQVSQEEFEDDQQGRRKPGIMRAEEFAQDSKGIKRVGYLRMDVDRLGQIFAKGLDEHLSLPRLAGLSRQMSYYFKVYLNSLAKNRADNLPNGSQQKDPPNLLFIYAGGDDLFISGSWNQVVDFACDVYRSFRLYTGEHPDITLSGGISIAGAKFPLYQAAAESGDAEHAAKGNGRDSLGLFGTALKWIEWLGSDNCVESREKILSIIHQEDEDYWKTAKPEVEELKLLGVLPFVTHIQKQQLQPNYSRNFVRNLLAAAQLQEQRIEEIEQKRKLPAYENQLQDIRYYLHLPQIAYTLARLPKDVFKDDDFRKSIKHPYNAPYFRAIATWIELLTRSSER
jgi:CRISPR-associated protein Csm1